MNQVDSTFCPKNTYSMESLYEYFNFHLTRKIQTHVLIPIKWLENGRIKGKPWK